MRKIDKAFIKQCIKNVSAFLSSSELLITALFRNSSNSAQIAVCISKKKN